MVGMSTACFFPSETLSAAKSIASLGIKTCEIFFNSYSEYSKTFVSELNKIMKDNGITVNSIHAMTTQFEPQLFSAHENQYNDALNVFLKVADAAEILGAKYYTFHGQAYYKRGALGKKNFERIAERLSVLTEQLSDRKVDLSLENVHWATFSDPSFLSEIKKYKELDKLYYTLDIKQAAQSMYDINEYVRAMGNRISTVHLCDYIIDGETINTCLPGKGEFDFAALYENIKENGSNPAYIVEVYKGDYKDINELKSSVEYLNSIIK